MFPRVSRVGDAYGTRRGARTRVLSLFLSLPLPLSLSLSLFLFPSVSLSSSSVYRFGERYSSRRASLMSLAITRWFRFHIRAFSPSQMLARMLVTAKRWIHLVFPADRGRMGSWEEIEIPGRWEEFLF